MIAIVGCLLVGLECGKPMPPAAPVIISASCSLSRAADAITCRTKGTPPRSASDSGTRAQNAYAILYLDRLVVDSTAHRWTVSGQVKNLLAQSIGTSDGVSVDGVEISVADLQVTKGNGLVTIADADADDVGAIDGPSLLHSSETVAPGALSTKMRFKLNVPITVEEVSFDIAVSAYFPAVRNAKSSPPTTVESWVEADTNVSGPTDSVHVSFVKRVLALRFHFGTLLVDRQLAIALVDGHVVGGRRDGPYGPEGIAAVSDGLYYLQVPDDGSGAQLVRASIRLSKLPQVQMAIVQVILGYGSH